MSELTRRVLFGVIAAPLGILVVFYGGAALAALLAIVSALGAWEFYRIARGSGLTLMEDVGIPLAGVVPLFVHARYLRVYDVVNGSNGYHDGVQIALTKRRTRGLAFDLRYSFSKSIDSGIRDVSRRDCVREVAIEIRIRCNPTLLSQLIGPANSKTKGVP